MIPSPLSIILRDESIVPIVYRNRPHKNLEAELMATLACGDAARSPVDGSDRAV